MSFLSEWSIEPFVFLVAALVVAHEAGLAHLASRSTPGRAAGRRRRSLIFYGGLGLFLLAVTSPLDYWGYDYFFVHMIQHIVIMFFAPILIVVGRPWLPLVHAVPVRVRRRVGRAVFLGRWSGAVAAIGRVATNGVVAVVAFNVVMVVWHLPVPFDAADTNRSIHWWLMEGSFLVAGVFFWAQIIPSYPLRPRLSAVGRAGALLVTNFVMFILAMALSVFTTRSWYSVYDHIAGVSLSPFADQQIGAGILWICGDFWALPALIWVVRRAVEEEGSAGALLDRLLFHRPSLVSQSRAPRA
jgi:putative membrane protein